MRTKLFGGMPRIAFWTEAALAITAISHGNTFAVVVQVDIPDNQALHTWFLPGFIGFRLTLSNNNTIRPICIHAIYVLPWRANDKYNQLIQNISKCSGSFRRTQLRTLCFNDTASSPKINQPTILFRYWRL